MLAGGLALVTAAAAPWVVGSVTERQWRQATDELNTSQSLFELATEHYDRRYLGADLAGTLIIQNPQTGETTAIPYHGEVSHRLWGSELRFSLEQAFGEAAAELFPQEQPRLVVDTRLWGTVLVELEVPAISVDDPDTGESLNLAESYGWAEIGDGGRQVDMDLRWPGLAVRGPGMRVGMDDLRLSQSMARIKGDVWAGEGEIRMARLELVDDARASVALENLTVTSETTSEDGDRRFTSHSELALENVVVDDQSIGPHRLSFELAGAEVDSWNRLTDALGQLQTLGSAMASLAPQAQFERQRQVMAQVSEALRQLAGHGISLNMPELSLQTPAGAMTGSLALRHPQLDEPARQQMLMVMPGLEGELELSVPEALLEQYPALRPQLLPAIEQGLLVPDGNRLRLKAHLQDLEVDINGQVWPLPPMI